VIPPDDSKVDVATPGSDAVVTPGPSGGSGGCAAGAGPAPFQLLPLLGLAVLGLRRRRG
jgi:hypothetical protein